MLAMSAGPYPELGPVAPAALRRLEAGTPSARDRNCAKHEAVPGDGAAHAETAPVSPAAAGTRAEPTPAPAMTTTAPAATAVTTKDSFTGYSSVDVLRAICVRSGAGDSEC